jgi:DMSO reductase anchor subunit
MHPAFSVIFFTAVSGAGYGLLFLIGLAIALDPLAADPAVALLALGVGAVFAAAGLTSSLLHLGQPQRAWRALSQWRSSWLSREGVAALVSFVPILILGALLWHLRERLALHELAPASITALRTTGAVLASAAAVTVFCTARIYTSLKTIAAWHNAYVLPGYLLLGLLGGASLLWLLDAAAGAGSAAWLRRGLPLLVGACAVACGLLKRTYWRFIDTAPAASTPESATGLGRFGAVRSVEAPHTEENYLTREMGFVLARKHAARLRAIAGVAFALLPLLLAVLALVPALALVAPALAIVASVCAIAGTFVERWLFFAEAKHVVMLYYGAARS